VVGGFEFAGRLVLGVGTVVEAAIGERAAQAFVTLRRLRPPRRRILRYPGQNAQPS
jgi:hypothetical protein